MHCLHLYPRDLRIPDWERGEDVFLTFCPDCGKVLDIRLLSPRSGESPKPPEGEHTERPVGIVY